MKVKYYLIVLIAFLNACIGTDYETEVNAVLRINSSTSSMRVSGSFQFDFEYTNRLAQMENIAATWQSSNTSVITIDGNGNATAIAEGTATITVGFDGLEDTQSVEVLPSKESISISTFVSVLPVGNSTQFEYVYLDLEGQTATPESAVWSSSDPSTLSIDQQGNVTALKSGTVSISIESGAVTDEVSVECTSTVIMVDEEIRITMFTNSMELDANFTFEASFYNTSGEPDGSVPISWESSNPSVISISSAGLATANEVGTVNLIASSGSITESVQVEVLAPNVSERIVVLDSHGSGYIVEGEGVLKVVDGEVFLDIKGVKVEGPGPYLYLSNSSSNVNGGLNLGPVGNGDVLINVSAKDSEVDLATYDYVVVWCQPFGVLFGYGRLSDD
ncbi:MAG: DM13 domain-containing protein [Cyclobacteriaceae bacterium]